MRRITEQAFRRRVTPFLAIVALEALAASGQGTRNGPTQDQLRALLERVVVNQHGNDQALTEFERVERQMSLRSDSDDPSAVKEDKTYRVFPTGTGIIRVVLRDHDQPMDAALIQQQIANVARELERATQPDDPKQRPKLEKFEKRQKERHELVEATREAFRATWLGRETRDGRTLAKVRLDPNPEFKPKTRGADMFRHVQVVVWIDEPIAQLARAEATITRDISFGGGVLGKVYKGGTFVMEQAQVAPGVWLPTRYQFDFSGRKFLFGFSVHDRIEVRDYRRLGPPGEALATIRRELQSGGTANSTH